MFGAKDAIPLMISEVHAASIVPFLSFMPLRTAAAPVMLQHVRCSWSTSSSAATSYAFQVQFLLEARQAMNAKKEDGTPPTPAPSRPWHELHPHWHLGRLH